MKKKNIYSKYCKLIWFFMLITVVLSVFHGFMLYKYFQIHPQTEYTIDKNNPVLPEEALNKITLINNLRGILGIGLCLLVLYFFCDYKAEPEKSCFGGLVKSFKKIKLEDE